MREFLLASEPMQFSKIMAEVFKRVPGEWAGKSAIDIALMDWVGQKLGIPLYSYFGLDPKDAPLTWGELVGKVRWKRRLITGDFPRWTAVLLKP